MLNSIAITQYGNIETGEWINIETYKSIPSSSHLETLMQLSNMSVYF